MIRTNRPLDLPAAWRHTRRDWQYTPFEAFFFAIEDLIEADAPDWFDDVQSRLRGAGYELSPLRRHPGYIAMLNASLRRPVYLEPDDHLLFTAVVGALVPSLIASGLNRYALCGPSFAADDAGAQWVTSPATWFEHFELRSRSLLDGGDTHVAVLDVAGYFGAIRHEHLRVRLLDEGCAPEYVALLLQMLAAWFPDGKGVPWSAASHVLGAAYLAGIDAELEAAGLRFVRVVDDYRVFCRSKTEAEDVRDLITARFQALGLTANPRKTKVTTGESLALYPTALVLRRALSRSLVQLIGALESHGQQRAANAGRRLAYHFLRTAYRGYLGRLIAELPRVDDLLLALATGALPAFYMTFAIPSIVARARLDVGDETVARLQEIAVSPTVPGPRGSIARALLLALSRHRDVRLTRGTLSGVDDESQVGRLEALLFAPLLPAETWLALLEATAGGGYLVSRARQRLVTATSEDARLPLNS